MIDGRAGSIPDAREMWMRAYLRTVAIWFEEQLIVVR
jgi:hypothetical protein